MSAQMHTKLEHNRHFQQVLPVLMHMERNLSVLEQRRCTGVQTEAVCLQNVSFECHTRSPWPRPGWGDARSKEASRLAVRHNVVTIQHDALVHPTVN